MSGAMTLAESNAEGATQPRPQQWHEKRLEEGPLLDRVWPHERKLRESGLTRHFTELAVNSGEAFPEALNQLLPYIMPLERNGGVFPIKKSNAPEDFPHETLGLLWCLFGPSHSGNRNGVQEILERLIKADPKIELDRRLQ